MIELTGTLKERVEEAVRLVCTEISQEEIDNFCALYEKAGIKLFSASIDFFKKYGGAYRNSYIVLEDSRYNKEISLHCFDNITDFYYSYKFAPEEIEKEALRRLDFAMDSIKEMREFAGVDVHPIAEIGYYYPADVYIGENGKLYCLYEFKDEFEVHDTPAEILEPYLKNNIPIGVDRMPVKTNFE